MLERPTSSNDSTRPAHAASKSATVPCRGWVGLNWGGVGCVPVEDESVEDEPVQDVPVEDEPVQDVPVMPVMPICWPLLTDQYNFDPLFEVEDVLELGPIGKI